MADSVNHPSHYRQGGVECIDAIEAATADKPGPEAALVASILRYVWRYRAKGGAESLRKARWYLDRLIDKVEAPIATTDDDEGRWYTSDDLGGVDEDGVPYVDDNGLLPTEVEYIATDLDGRCFMFEHKPTPRGKGWFGGGIYGRADHYGLTDRPWTETLRRVRR